ncbi:hypothetical protein B0H11DRAFT_1938746 [Mycena galericulata]|nr:hypothetical protein B0H11DRAFT_1938746 [Mycena galericulata]
MCDKAGLDARCVSADYLFRGNAVREHQVNARGTAACSGRLYAVGGCSARRLIWSVESVRKFGNIAKFYFNLFDAAIGTSGRQEVEIQMAGGVLRGAGFELRDEGSAAGGDLRYADVVKHPEKQDMQIKESGVRIDGGLCPLAERIQAGDGVLEEGGGYEVGGGDVGGGCGVGEERVEGGFQDLGVGAEYTEARRVPSSTRGLGRRVRRWMGRRRSTYEGHHTKSAPLLVREVEGIVMPGAVRGVLVGASRSYLAVVKGVVVLEPAHGAGRAPAKEVGEYFLIEDPGEVVLPVGVLGALAFEFAEVTGVVPGASVNGAARRGGCGGVAAGAAVILMCAVVVGAGGGAVHGVRGSARMLASRLLRVVGAAGRWKEGGGGCKGCRVGVSANDQWLGGVKRMGYGLRSDGGRARVACWNGGVTGGVACIGGNAGRFGVGGSRNGEEVETGGGLGAAILRRWERSVNGLEGGGLRREREDEPEEPLVRLGVEPVEDGGLDQSELWEDRYFEGTGLGRALKTSLPKR